MVITLGSLWQVSVDGNEPASPVARPGTLLPANVAANGLPTGNISFSSQQGNIWALAEKGNWFGKASGQPFQLTSGPMTFFSPLPSKDGKKLFVVGALARGELARYDTKSAEFVPFLSGISADSVSFSKDGQWVAYVQLSGGDALEKQVGRQPADSAQLPAARCPAASAGHPMASRSFSMPFCPASKVKLYTVSTDGGTPRELIPEDLQNELDPTWSPDGTRIVFGGASADPQQQLSGSSTSRLIKFRPCPAQKAFSRPAGRPMDAMSSPCLSIPIA